MKRLRTLPALLCLMLSTAHCAGARGQLVLNEARHPVSMSGALYDADGSVVGPEQLEVVGRYEESLTYWSVLYSLLSLTGEVDLSPAVNAAIQAKGGQGMVRFATRTTGCALNYFIVFNLLPIWPGCSTLDISADIVRKKAGGAPAPTGSTPPVAGPEGR